MLLHVTRFAGYDKLSLSLSVLVQVIGLSSSSSQDRRRARRASVATRGGDTVTGRESSGGKGGGSDAKSPGSPASEGDAEDPEVIIARRNAEHRRMQVRLWKYRRLIRKKHIVTVLHRTTLAPFLVL